MVESLACGGFFAVERLYEAELRLRFSFDDLTWSADVLITVEELKRALQEPHQRELRCGRHSVFLALDTERTFGGVVAVLHAQCVIQNETLMDVNVFPGATPRLPEDRQRLLPDLQKSAQKCDSLSLLMVPWPTNINQVSLCPCSSLSLDDWNDVSDEAADAQAKGSLRTASPEITLHRDERRFPFLVGRDDLLRIAVSGPLLSFASVSAPLAMGAKSPPKIERV